MKEKHVIQCSECEGLGRIPVCPEPRYDEWEECPVCEGHGGWVEEFSEAELDKLYPQLNDDEINLMYEDSSVSEAIQEAKGSWNNDY